MNGKKLTAVILSAALISGAGQAANRTFRLFPAAAEIRQTAAAGAADNPCNKQDDAEVPYDGSRWVQPSEWNCPHINPRDYQGGIMLFFDKIGLEPEYSRGKVQRVYFSIRGAEVPVCMMKFHLYYDTRLKVKANADGEVITPGKAVANFTTGSAMVEEGQLAFYAYSPDDVEIPNSSLFTADFIIPEDAEPGDFYPIGLAYTDDGIVCDTFINSARDDAGKLQMTYVFSKGIYNGYLKIMGEKPTTTAPVTTEPPVTTSFTAAEPDLARGDADGNGTVSVEDAQLALKAYTEQLAGNETGLSERQRRAADVSGDGALSVEDAQYILIWYVNNTVAGNPVTWEELLPDD